jgi:hypothetical protein
MARSEPVLIQIVVPAVLPIVRVTPRDAFAVEPASNIELNTAAFRIRRFGPTNEALIVNYSVQGTAQNGVDYELLSGQATIAAGSRSVLVTVRPLADNALERIETVILRLEDPPQPPSYRVAFPRRAVALISDRPVSHGWGEGRCDRLENGLLHLGFGADSGRNFRIETSTDLRNWETVFDTPALDGAFHFVDEGETGLTHRFYRMTPEPVVETE